jgi:hypothetical protein
MLLTRFSSCYLKRNVYRATLYVPHKLDFIIKYVFLKAVLLMVFLNSSAFLVQLCVLLFLQSVNKYQAFP